MRHKIRLSEVIASWALFVAATLIAGGCTTSSIGDGGSLDANADPADDTQGVCADVVCDDSNLCTVDTCVVGDDGEAECEYTPMQCPEGSACHPQLGQCVTSTEIDPCDDGNPCTTDVSNATGGCTNTPIACSDGYLCNPETGECELEEEPECLTDADCDDGVFCNGAETCSEEVCIDGDEPCDSDQTCDESSGTCTDPGIAVEISGCPTQASFGETAVLNASVTGVDPVGTPTYRWYSTGASFDQPGAARTIVTIIGVDPVITVTVTVQLSDDFMDTQEYTGTCVVLTSS